MAAKRRKLPPGAFEIQERSLTQALAQQLVNSFWSVSPEVWCISMELGRLNQNLGGPCGID